MARKASHHRRASRSRKRTRVFVSLWAAVQWRWILGLISVGAAFLTLLSLLSREHGSLTDLWLGILRRAFGWGAYVVPVGLALFGVWLLSLGANRPIRLPRERILGGMFLFFASLALTHHIFAQGEAPVERYGGYVGRWLSQTFSWALSWAGTVVLLVILVGVGLTLLFGLSFDQVAADFIDLVARFLEWLKGLPLLRRKPHNSRMNTHVPPWDSRLQTSSADAPLVAHKELTPQPAVEAEAVPSANVSASTLGGAGQWILPNIKELLVEADEMPMSLSDIREKTRVIEETLRSLGVPATVVEVNPGPVVTQFGLEPGYIERRDRDGKVKRAKVKVSRIAALANDLALALAASPIRIEAPVPGKGIVGLEIPNSQIALVSLRGVMESEQFQAISSSPLALALGRDVSGAAVVDDLSKLPHLLIAGATGSGKSVCINALIACLLLRNTPNELRLLMIDPKRVELSSYNGIPHLLAPVVVEMDRVVGVLNWVTREMDRRYRIFARVGARNIQAYNEVAAATGEAPLPFIVVFIDELADLMMVAPEEVERLICRIAQMARATGIHLVIATQRPSVDVVTGLIKANFPARISFAVSSQVDSRVILDMPGAEKLLGRGDALYMAPDSPKVVRMQGCYVSDAELNRLVSFWQSQAAQHGDKVPISPDAGALSPMPLAQQIIWPAMRAEKDEQEADPLLPEAISLVRQEKKASVSFLQRKLRIGYTRAARLIDLLEQRGIIGPATGTSKLREVLDQAGEMSVSGGEGHKREII